MLCLPPGANSCICFDRDEALCQSVYDHLCPAIIRFRHGIPNENPLMQEIHTLYERTFQVARNSVSVIEEYFHCNVSDDEVAFSPYTWQPLWKI